MSKKDKKTSEGQKSSFVDESKKFIDKRRSNIKSDLIEITADKLENILLKHLTRLTTFNAWITPLSIVIALLITQITTTFKDSLWIKADVWQAVFLLSTVAAVVWLLITAVRAIRNRKQTSIKYLIDCISATDTNEEDAHDSISM